MSWIEELLGVVVVIVIVWYLVDVITGIKGRWYDD